MNESELIALFWVRDESALELCRLKYGALCRRIAQNILGNAEDAEECVNDTYLSLWNAIPPNRPRDLAAYISRIARNTALKRYEYNSAVKRCSEASCSLSELEECVSGEASVEGELENKYTEQAINSFLHMQAADKRAVFVLRYWYCFSIDEISGQTGFSRSKVTSMLHAMRLALKKYLEREGINI